MVTSETPNRYKRFIEDTFASAPMQYFGGVADVAEKVADIGTTAWDAWDATFLYTPREFWKSVNATAATTLETVPMLNPLRDTPVGDFADIPPVQYTRHSNPFNDDVTQFNQSRINILLEGTSRDGEKAEENPFQFHRTDLDGNQLEEGTIHFPFSPEELLRRFEESGISPSEISFLQGRIKREHVDSIRIYNYDEEYRKRFPKKWQWNEERKETLRNDPEYIAGELEPAKYESMYDADKAGTGESHAYDTQVFHKTTIIPSNDIIGDVDAGTFFDQVKASVHDAGYYSPDPQALLPILAGRIFGGFGTLATSEMYASGVYAEYEFEKWADYAMVAEGVAMRSPGLNVGVRSTLYPAKAAYPTFKTHAKNVWKGLSIWRNNNPTANDSLIKHDSVFNFAEGLRKSVGASPEETEIIINMVANRSATTYGNPYKAFDDIQLATGANDKSFDIFRDSSTGAYFESPSGLILPNQNKRYFKVEGGEELIIRTGDEAEEVASPSLRTPIFRSNVDEVVELENTVGQWSNTSGLRKDDLLNTILKDSHRYNGQVPDLDIGLRMSDADISMMGIREWVENYPGGNRAIIPWDELSNRAKADSMHIVMHQGLDPYSHPLFPGEYLTPGYNRSDEVILLGYDFSETLGNRSTFNRSNIDAILDPTGTGERFRVTYNKHYTVGGRDMEPPMSPGYYDFTSSFRLNIPLSGQITDPNWRSNYKVDEDIYSHIRTAVRAYYGDNNDEILEALSINEFQTDWIQNIVGSRGNVQRIYNSVLLEDTTDVFSFWRSQLGTDYTGTYRHTNATPISLKTDDKVSPITKSYQLITDPQWGKTIQLGPNPDNMFFNQYQRSINIIGASDEIGQNNIDTQFNLIIEALSGYRQSDEILEVARRADDTKVIKEVAYAFNAEEFADVALRTRQHQRLEKINSAKDKQVIFLEDTDEFDSVKGFIGNVINQQNSRLAPKMRASATDDDQVFIHVRMTSEEEGMHPVIEIIMGYNPVLDLRKQAPLDGIHQAAPKFSSFVRQKNSYAGTANHDQQIEGLNRWPGIKGSTDVNEGFYLRDYRNTFKENVIDDIFSSIMGRSPNGKFENISTLPDPTKGVIGTGLSPRKALFSRDAISKGETGYRIVKNRDGTFSALDGRDVFIDSRDTRDEVIDAIYQSFDQTTKGKIPESSWLLDSYLGQAMRLMMQKASIDNHPGLLWSSKEFMKERYIDTSAPIEIYKGAGKRIRDTSIHDSIAKSIVGILKQNGYDAPSAKVVAKEFIGTKKVLIPEDDPFGTDFLPYKVVSTDENFTDEELKKVDLLIEGLRNFDLNDVESIKSRMWTDLESIPMTPKEKNILEDTLSVLQFLDSQGSPPKLDPGFEDSSTTVYPKDSLMNMIQRYGLNEGAAPNRTDINTILTELAHQAQYHTQKDLFSGDVNPSNILKLTARNTDGEGQFFNFLDLDKPIPYKLRDVNNKKIESRYETLGDILRDVPIRQNQIRPNNNGQGKVLGYVDLFKDGKAFIKFLEGADFGTAVHEVAHTFRRTLNPDELEQVGRIIMGDADWDALPNKNMWTVDAEEAFANAVETYITTGKYKTGLKATLDKFITYIKDLYRAIRGTTAESKMNPKLVEFLDGFIDVGRPTEESIRANFPAHEVDNVLRFHGYPTNVIRTAPIDSHIEGVPLHELAGHALTRTRLFKTVDDNDFNTHRETIKSREQAVNELPWDEVKKWEQDNLDPEVYELDLLPNIGTMDEKISSEHIMGSWERLATTYPFKWLIGIWNPRAASRDPLIKSIYILRDLEVQGSNLTSTTMSSLLRLGSSEKVFGSFDQAGRIADGPLKGFNLNDIRSNPLDPRWRNKITVEQSQWIRTAESIERAKLAMLKAEGIDIRTLPEDEGAGTIYAGRRMFARISEGGEVLDVINMGSGSRPGAKASFEKGRKFETMEEAIQNGYRYLSEEEALGLNLEAAYRRVAGERWGDYIINNLVNTRTSAANKTLKLNRDISSKRLKNIKALLKQLQQTKRGENIHPSTLRSLKENFPSFAGSLDEISKVTLNHLIDAGEKAKGQPIGFTPTKEMIAEIFAKVLELESQVEALQRAGRPVPHELSKALSKARQSHAFKKFARGQAYQNFKDGKGFKYEFYRSANSILIEPRVGLIDQLLEAVGGHSVPGSRRKVGGLLQSASEEAANTQKAFADSGQKAVSTNAFEGTVDIPKLRGRIFTEEQPAWANGKTGKEITAILLQEVLESQQGFTSGFAQVLRASSPLNAAFKFFSLGGDASPFLIHLQMAWGATANRPGASPEIAKGFVVSLFNPKFQHEQIHQNRELLAKYPDVIISHGGATENTDYVEMLRRGGYSRFTPLRVGSKLVQAPYKPFMQAFTSLLDGAAIQLLKIHDELGVTPKSREELSGFVNEIRGLHNSKRLGVSAKQRDIERQSLLAAQYFRSIGAVIFDLLRPEKRLPRFGQPINPDFNVRSQLARQALARGTAGLSMLTMAGAIANGAEVEDLTDLLNPMHPQFMTVNSRGNEIGIGGKYRSLLRLFGQVAYAANEGDWESLSPKNITMDNPYFRWARGQLSWTLGGAITAGTGRTYLGDRIYGGGMNGLDIAQAVGRHYVAPLMGPMWAVNSILESGDIADRVTRAGWEFTGGRTYPEGSTAILNEFAQDMVGVDYEDMYSFERKLMRQILEDKLEPIKQERLARGDKYAEYWNTLESIDDEFYALEWNLLEAYQQGTGLFRNPDNRTVGRLLSAFYDLQSQRSKMRDDANKQHEMFQDDVEYDADDPEKYIIGEWYNTYDMATVNGVFDSNKLEQVQRDFYNRKLPNGTSFKNFAHVINMETHTTKHPIGWKAFLPRSTVETWEQSAMQRANRLKGRGKWDEVFDKYGITDQYLGVWSKEPPILILEPSR